MNVVRESAEKRETFSDENWDAGDDEALNESGAQETLDRDSAVDVEVMSAGGFELRDYSGGCAGHLFDFASDYS